MTDREQDLIRQIDTLKYLFCDKWTPAIVAILAKGRMRRSEILSALNTGSTRSDQADRKPVLHDSVLTRTLKKMTEEGLLVRRQVDESFPPQVYYSLTPPVVGFLRAIEPAVEWARRNTQLVAKAQAHRSCRNTARQTAPG